MDRVTRQMPFLKLGEIWQRTAACFYLTCGILYCLLKDMRPSVSSELNEIPSFLLSFFKQLVPTQFIFKEALSDMMDNCLNNIDCL